MARKLSEFIHDEMNSTENGRCVMFSLVYPKEGDKEVHSIRLTGESAPSPEELARTFTDIAETDAQAYEALSVAYMLHSFFERTGGAYIHRFPVRVKGHQELFSNNTELEGPNDNGERMQRMRHKEDNHDAVIRMAGTTFQALGSIVRELREDRTAMKDENVEMFGLLRDVLMQRALDTHTYRMEEQRYERTSMEIKKLWDSAPSMLRMLGVPIPEGTADTNLLESLIDGLTEEQAALIGKLVMSFPPEKAMPLMDRMAKIQEKLAKEKMAAKEADRKKKEAEAAAITVTATPHANGNGRAE